MNTTLCILGTALTAGLLASCQSSDPGKPEAAPLGPVVSALQSGHWYQVRKKPPTYFPKGTPADHPTDFRDGSWVYSGDQQDSRFFIPANRTKLPQQHLIAEAQTTMTPDARKELDRQGREIVAQNVASGTLKGVVTVLGAIGEAMANMPSTGSYRPPKKIKKSQPTAPSPSPPASGQ